MRHRLLAVSLAAVSLLCGCQSWRTITLTLDRADPAAIREAVSATAAANGLRPCSEWNVGVPAADLCFGGELGLNRITVVGFQRSSAYDLKIGFYSAALGDPALRERIETRCREALTLAAPGAHVERSESNDLLTVQR